MNLQDIHADIGHPCITLLRNYEKNIAVSKVKAKLLIHIPNYKLNRIIDRTYRSFKLFPGADKTSSASLKTPEIPGNLQ